jgi:translation initiation factor 2 subunit 1
VSPLDVPEDGDYIIGRVTEVKDFGATLELLEYTDQKAFVHISEVASGWVKYIRDFIREGQMVVAKVTKVKKGSKIIDASVRQVSGHRKKEKIREWKNEQRASKLLELVANNIKMDYDKLREDVRNDLVNSYGSLYVAFEESVINGDDFKKSWKGSWVPEFIKVGIENVTPPYVTIGGMLSLVSEKEDGVEGIKASLMGPEAIHEDSKLTITSDGAPNYRILVKAPNYKQAEEELKSAVDLVLKVFKKEGGVGSFERA